MLLVNIQNKHTQRADVIASWYMWVDVSSLFYHNMILMIYLLMKSKNVRITKIKSCQWPYHILRKFIYSAWNHFFPCLSCLIGCFKFQITQHQVTPSAEFFYISGSLSWLGEYQWFCFEWKSLNNFWRIWKNIFQIYIITSKLWN